MAYPAVTLDAQVFDEARLATLAEVCGLADNDHALGKMSRLWRAATQRQHYTVSQAIVRGILGPAGVDGLVVAELGELVDQHLPTEWAAKLDLAPPSPRPGELVMRLRGTRTRIEAFGGWLYGKRQGGRAAAASAKELGRSGGRFKSHRDAVDSAVVKPVEELLIACESADSASPERCSIIPGVGNPDNSRTSSPPADDQQDTSSQPAGHQLLLRDQIQISDLRSEPEGIEKAGRAPPLRAEVSSGVIAMTWESR